jgi:hypothetical protein
MYLAISVYEYSKTYFLLYNKADIFLFTTTSRLTLGWQSSMWCLHETLSLWKRQVGSEGGLSLLSSAEFKNAWSYISAPPYMMWSLIKHRGNFCWCTDVITLKLKLNGHGYTSCITTAYDHLNIISRLIGPTLVIRGWTQFFTIARIKCFTFHHIVI